MPQVLKGVSRATLAVVPSLKEDSLIIGQLSISSRDAQTPLTEFDEEVSPSLALSYRKGHDTTNVEILRTALLFAKIAQEARPTVIEVGHHVEQERFNVIEQRLVIEEHSGQQAQVLAVDLSKYRSVWCYPLAPRWNEASHLVPPPIYLEY